MGFALALLLIFALALIGAPIGLSVANHPLSGMSSLIMVCSGVVLFVLCIVVIAITKLYRKTKASEAFVRTGMSGLKVVRDGGAIVLPVVHQVVSVPLETIRLEVKRADNDALITSDRLRADIKAEFFVRVLPQDEPIQAAARSLGDKGLLAVASLLEDKLVSALRTAAARKTLEQLNAEREDFLKEVMSNVKSDIEHNGFTLETVTISSLDQANSKYLKQDNIFDAQGARTSAEIIQNNLTKKNEIDRQNEQIREQQNVEAKKRILEFEKQQAEAVANQAAEVAIIQAEQSRVTQEKQIEAQRQVEVAQVEMAKSIEVAKQVQQRDVEAAQKQKEKAIVEAQQQVEVAKRTSLEAVAKAEGLKALEEAKLADAEAKRQEARQGIITVEEIAKADRDKKSLVIAAEAAADKDLVLAQRKADADAYKVKAAADAQKASADAEAEAIRKKAEADAEAKKLAAEGTKATLLAAAEGERAKLLAEAEGQRALAMVPVEVKAKDVVVQRDYVENVLKPELETRDAHGKAGQDFELTKLRITAEQNVRIEAARAMAQIQGKIEATIVGTPDDVARMNQSFFKGMSTAQMIDGFIQGADPATLETAKKVVEGVGSAGAALAGKLIPKSDS